MKQCYGFAPVINAQSTVLILGSMPGVRSLTLEQYYAHPQNRFWPLIAALFGYAQVPTIYEERLAMLLDNHIALWDVLSSCKRNGSLDTAITADEANDFPAFFSAHPQITKVCFNGGKAHETYRKHHKSLLNNASIAYAALPSTSPANAKWRLGDLKKEWGYALA